MLPDAPHSYLADLHAGHFLLQQSVFHEEQLCFTLRLGPLSALAGELRLQVAEGLLQRRLLLLAPPALGGLRTRRGFPQAVVSTAERVWTV